MSATDSSALPLASFPVEILENITSFLPAQDVLVTLLSCGNRMLEHKLKHGGVVSLSISSLRDCRKDVKLLSTIPSLLAVRIQSDSIVPRDMKLLLACLPLSLRKLHIVSPWAFEIMDNFSIAKSCATAPFDDYEEHSPSISERYPHLTYLHMEVSRRRFHGSRYVLEDFVASLPPSLTYLSLQTRSSPCLKRLPYQLQALHSPPVLISEIKPFTVPCPSMHTVSLAHRIEYANDDEYSDTGSKAPLLQQILLATFPALQSLRLTTSCLSLFDFRLLPHLHTLSLELERTTSVKLIFSIVPPTLTALEFTNSELVLRASDAELPRLMSLSKLTLDKTNRLFSAEDIDDPLSILVALCPNVTDFTSHIRLKSNEQLPPLTVATERLNASLTSLDMTFDEIFPAFANFSQLHSITSQGVYSRMGGGITQQRVVSNVALRYPLYLDDIISKLPSTVSTLKIEDLRLRDEDIQNFCDAISASSSDGSAPSLRLPYDWTFDETESLKLGEGYCCLEPRRSSNSLRPFTSVTLHPTLDPSRLPSCYAHFPHVPTILALLPRTLTALETKFDIPTLNDSFSALFTPAAFPSLRSLKTPRLIDMKQWSKLESLKVSRYSSPFTDGNGFGTKYTTWVDLLPPNLSHLSAPSACCLARSL